MQRFVGAFQGDQQCVVASRGAGATSVSRVHGAMLWSPASAASHRKVSFLFPALTRLGLIELAPLPACFHAPTTPQRSGPCIPLSSKH